MFGVLIVSHDAIGYSGWLSTSVLVGAKRLLLLLLLLLLLSTGAPLGLGWLVLPPPPFVRSTHPQLMAHGR
jgi:hypothetical protein